VSTRCAHHTARQHSALCSYAPPGPGQCASHCAAPGFGGQADRHACEFDCFFSCPAGSTPPHLLQRGVYSQVAVALKGGAWRDTSMVLLVKALAMDKEEVEAAKEGHDVLGQGTDAYASQLMRASLARLSAVRRSLARAVGSSQRLLKRLRHSVGGSSSALVTSTAVESSLEAQHAQRPIELALNQPHLASHEGQEVTLGQLPGTSIKLGASRRDQRRHSSVLSAASSVARHYRPLDDDMEVAQDGL
jgi:hypothetical protein